MTKKTLVLIGMGIVVVGMAASYMLATTIPPASLTMTRLEIMRMAGDKLRGGSGTCPTSVAQLSETSPKHPKGVDGWGHPIVLKCEPNGPATLESLGADGKPGGTNDDADLSLSF